MEMLMVDMTTVYVVNTKHTIDKILEELGFQ